MEQVAAEPVCGLPQCFDQKTYPVIAADASSLEIAARGSSDLRRVYELAAYNHLPKPEKGQYETSDAFLERQRKETDTWNYDGFNAQTRFVLTIPLEGNTYDADRQRVSLPSYVVGARPSHLDIDTDTGATTSNSAQFEDGSSLRVRERTTRSEAFLFVNILRPQKLAPSGYCHMSVDFTKQPDSPTISFSEAPELAKQSGGKYFAHYVVSYGKPANLGRERWCYESGSYSRTDLLEAGGVHSTISSTSLANVLLHRIVITDASKSRVLWERSFD